MASPEARSDAANPKEGNTNGSSSSDSTVQQYTGRYGPLAKVNTAESRLPPFGGEFQPIFIVLLRTANSLRGVKIMHLLCWGGGPLAYEVR